MAHAPAAAAMPIDHFDMFHILITFLSAHDSNVAEIGGSLRVDCVCGCYSPNLTVILAIQAAQGQPRGLYRIKAFNICAADYQRWRKQRRWRSATRKRQSVIWLSRRSPLHHRRRIVYQSIPGHSTTCNRDPLQRVRVAQIGWDFGSVRALNQ